MTNLETALHDLQNALRQCGKAALAERKSAKTALAVPEDDMAEYVRTSGAMLYAYEKWVSSMEDGERQDSTELAALKVWLATAAAYGVA